MVKTLPSKAGGASSTPEAKIPRASLPKKKHKPSKCKTKAILQQIQQRLFKWFTSKKKKIFRTFLVAQWIKNSPFHQVYVLHLIYPFIFWHSCLGNYRQRCYEHGSRHLLNGITLFPSHKYPGVGLPDGLVALFWILLRSFHTVLQSAEPVCIPNSVTRVSFPPHLRPHPSSPVFLVPAVLTGERWHLLVFLICLSQCFSLSQFLSWLSLVPSTLNTFCYSQSKFLNK